MDRNKAKNVRRTRRKTGIRKRVIGTPERPRLTVYRSVKHMYAQIVDDLAGRTLVSASTGSEKLSTTGNVEAAKVIGKAVASEVFF